MKRIHRDAVSALVGIVVFAGAIWWLLASLNPVR